MKKFVILLIFSLVILAAGFYYRGQLFSFYYTISKKLPEIENISVGSLLQDIERQISLPPPLFGPQDETGAALSNQGVIKWTNSNRALSGLAPLNENKLLNSAALSKAQDIIKNQYFDHVSPSGVGPADLAKATGYEYLAIGENLALGNFADDEKLVAAWMASPGHRENILNSKYKEIGVAVLQGFYEGRKTWVAVQEFGAPASACPYPNQSLKAQVEFMEKQAISLMEMIDAKRTAIDSGQFKNNSEINKAIKEHNALVAQYNDLNGQIKNLAASYNSQVSKFNECISQ